jgi:hypothetical protein
MRRGPMLERASLAALRREHALELGKERGPSLGAHASAAVAIATATADEVYEGRISAAPGADGADGAQAPPRGEWMLLPAPTEAGEGWCLVEKDRPSSGETGETASCSLSYVILQLEAPKLIEGHFDVPHHDSECLRIVDQLSAQLDALA